MAKLKLKDKRAEGPQAQNPARAAEEVAKLAYEIYRKRGGTHGSDWADWFEAEAELKNRR